MGVNTLIHVQKKVKYLGNYTLKSLVYAQRIHPLSVRLFFGAVEFHYTLSSPPQKGFHVDPVQRVYGAHFSHIPRMKK